MRPSHIPLPTECTKARLLHDNRYVRKFPRLNQKYVFLHIPAYPTYGYTP